MKLDRETGLITGKISRPGTYAFPVQISNSHGKANGTITVRIGQEMCLTPPMGWSSWYSYSGGVSQENILKTARLLITSGLAQYGYRYVNIDDCWQGARGGKYRAIQPNKRFPDMKSMCREIHSLGLKAGIYSTPWMGTYAGYMGGTSPNPQGDYSSLALPESKRPQPDQLFGSCPGSQRLGAAKTGPVWMITQDARQWAEWGFDYVKMDWYLIDVPSTERIAADLKKKRQGHCADFQFHPVRDCRPHQQNGQRLAHDGRYRRPLGQFEEDRFLPGEMAALCRTGALE